MAWTNRADDIRQRDWTEIIDQWADHGSSFDTADFTKFSLEQTAESLVTSESLNGNNTQIIEFDDRSGFLCELVFSQVKANHALVCAAQKVASGYPSWGAIDAYHASMLLMRTILSALGIFICRIHNRNILVDAFPWMGRPDYKKKFKKRHKNWARCAAIISCSSRDIYQEDLYSIFQRALNISTVSPDIWPEIVVQNILQTNKSHFSASRNRLIYGSRFWFNSDDLLGECLSINWASQAQRNMVSYTFTKAGDATEVDCYCDCWVLYILSLRLHRKIYEMFKDSLRVFDYITDRQEVFSLIERQFADQM